MAVKEKVRAKAVKNNEEVLEPMKSKLLLLDEPCSEAQKILEQEFEFIDGRRTYGESTVHIDMVYTQLTPVNCNVPVACPCTGTDHVNAPHIIHLGDEWKRGEGRNVTSTAEHTWSLILQLAKLKRMQLSGKIIGIIGYGRIGKQIRKYADAFGMNVIAQDNKDIWDYDGFLLCGGNKDVGLNGLLRQADIITLHVPLNNDTVELIGKREFELMKAGALLVNTSRPQIVYKHRLIQNLYSGKLGGYADDFKGHWSINHKSVIQTPHIGGNCIEARELTDIYIANKTIEYWRSRTHEGL